MDRVGIDCVTLIGNVVETNKPELDKNPKVATMVFKSRIEEGDFEDNHVWNVVEQNGKYFLVDTSFFVGDEPVMQEVEFDNEKRNTFILKLSNGKYRHYLSSGTIETISVDKVKH